MPMPAIMTPFLETLTIGGAFSGLTFGAVLMALIKGWPVLAKLSIDARAALRQERRDDLHDCQKRLNEMDARLTAGEARTHDVEMRSVSLLSAVTILATELQRLAPRSLALRQAQRLLIAAYPVQSEMPAFIADIIKPLEDVE